MRRRLLSFAGVTVVPTAVDVGLLVAFREGLGWPLVVADLVAISIAAVTSYVLHRLLTSPSNPYFRWVRYPAGFAAIAAVAAVVDAAVLRLTFTAAGYTTVAGLLAAKVVSLSFAVAVRAVGYRLLLSGRVSANRQRVDQSPSAGELRFSVVVPAYRERGRIGETVDRIRQELGDIAAEGGLEIIVVDDGSGDGTFEAALHAEADQVVALPRNTGKGAAVRAGMLASRGRAVAFTDADLAYPPEHLRSLLAEVEAGWDVVIGNRRHPASQVDGGGGLRAVGSRLVNALAAAVLLAKPLDTQCGLKGFRGDVARSLFARTRVDGFAFDIEVLHLVERAEWSLKEVPVHLQDPGGSSTVRVVADVLRLSLDLLRVRRWSSSGAYDDLRRTASPVWTAHNAE